MSLNLPDDPILNAAYNVALEWAAHWITGAQMEGHSAEVVEFAKNMAMSIRAGKREVGVQENFYDAVRADPYMPKDNKAFWLSLEGGPTPRAADFCPQGGSHEYGYMISPDTVEVCKKCGKSR